jgi:hypothetical protein
MGARHLGRDAALVEKDQPLRGNLRHLLAKGLAFTHDLGPILLGRPERLFLGRSLRRLSASQIT